MLLYAESEPRITNNTSATMTLRYGQVHSLGIPDRLLEVLNN